MIDVPSGTLKLRPGWWIVTEKNKEVHRIDPATFRENYQIINDQ